MEALWRMPHVDVDAPHAEEKEKEKRIGKEANEQGGFSSTVSGKGSPFLSLSSLIAESYAESAETWLRACLAKVAKSNPNSE